MVGSRVIWVQLNRPLKFPGRSIEVEVADVQNVRQRGVRFGQCVIEFERLFCSCLSLWIAILRSAGAIKRH
jgi:hypothetical protein